MNQKTLIVQAAEPAIMYSGMMWFDTDDDMLYQRDNANAAWDTIMKEELAHTITGLHTFDLGANPPFAVDAASTQVVNLIADDHAPTHKDGGSDELDVSELAGAIGAAGEVPETDGAAVAWVDPDLRYEPKVHAPTHKDGGTDELDVSELAGAIGAAGEVPETDGAAVTWVDPDSRYDPKAHVLATTGPHTDTLPLTDLAVGAQGEIIHRGAADWEALAVGVDGQVLMSGGAAADIAWEDHDKALHDALNIDADTLDAFDATDFPRIRDTQKNLQIAGVGETEICAYTIDGTDRIMRVGLFFRIITGDTDITATVKYTNVLGAAITCTLVDDRTLAVGDYTYAPVIFEIEDSSEITLNITASVADRVFASGTIEELV